MNSTKGSFTWFGVLLPALFALGCTLDTSETGEDVDSAREALPPINTPFWVSGVGERTTLVTHGRDAPCQAFDFAFGGYHLGTFNLLGNTCKYPIFNRTQSSTLFSTLHKEGTVVFTLASHSTTPPAGAAKSKSGTYVCFQGLASGERYSSDGKCHYVGDDGAHHVNDSYYFVSPVPVTPNP